MLLVTSSRNVVRCTCTPRMLSDAAAVRTFVNCENISCFVWIATPEKIVMCEFEPVSDPVY
jgi:hypothetical protein